MSIVIRLPPSLAERIDGRTRIELPAQTLGGALHALTAQYPVLQKLLWQAENEMNPVMLLFLNNGQLRTPALDLPLPDGTELDLVPAIEAG